MERCLDTVDMSDPTKVVRSCTQRSPSHKASAIRTREGCAKALIIPERTSDRVSLCGFIITIILGNNAK
jgi:hypothetical protein